MPARLADRSIVGGDDRSRAGANDDVDGDLVSGELLQDAHVTGAAQASPAQDDSNPNWPQGSAGGGMDPLLQVSAQARPPTSGCMVY